MLYVAIFQVGIALLLAVMVDSIKVGAGFLERLSFSQLLFQAQLSVYCLP